MRLGGPVFKKANSFEEEIALHRKFGFGAAYCQYIEEPSKRKDYKQIFRESDIVLAEFGAYCINILDTDKKLRQKNIDEICRRLAYADEMGVRCCVIHGGSIETGDWGNANPLNMSEKSFAETVTIVQGILDKIKPVTTKLVMETESYLLPDSPEIYVQLIKAIDRTGFAVHLDPVNIIASPRRFYFNAEFIERCFALLGPWIVSCHAKDLNMPSKHATVQIDETFIGDGILDYNTYLKEIDKLDPSPTLMIEHLNESQLIRGLKFIFKKAEEVGIRFDGSENRDMLSEIEDSAGEWFAPHL
ncbi:MAG: sugar phosphate isomerase/epimerase [Anaerolineae bacterium]|nr:sugar phosphate isomerase/epimerase [Anaerolineae bacterium]